MPEQVELAAANAWLVRALESDLAPFAEGVAQTGTVSAKANAVVPTASASEVPETL